jgi:subfamily B ATP-binding cassette protein MsbA
LTEGKPPPGHLSTGVLVKRLVRDEVRHYVGRLTAAFACMAAVAATTAILAYLMEPVLDDIFGRKDRDMLILVPLVVLAIFTTKSIATYGQAILMNHVGQRIIANLQVRLYSHLIHQDLAFYHGSATGTLVARFTNDLNLLRAAVSTALTGMVKDSLSIAFLVAVMFYQAPGLAVVAVLVFPLAILPVVKLGRRMRRASARAQVQVGEFTTLLDETFKGARHVKAYGMEDYEIARARAAAEGMFHRIMKVIRVRALSTPVMEALGGVAIAVVIYYGGWQVIEGETTAGAFFSFITALLFAYQPMKSLANLNANLQEGLAAAQRVYALLDQPPRVVDRADARPLEVAGGAIRFDDVHFAYGDNAPALEGVSIDVPAGRTVALVGPSGAGKSTVLNLIPRFYDIAAGTLTIDGQEVRGVTLASLRGAVGLVSQEVSLFNDTVRANIAYGRPGASEDDIIGAATAAAAHEFITAMPEGYDTVVGEQGAKLSGGQRQRIAIARAMLKNAPILLLDEATSALDTESERAVQDALRRLMAGRTTVVIAHRLSTILDADRIYVIDGGRVVESGAHSELLARRGAYARLYGMQFADDTVSDASAQARA